MFFSSSDVEPYNFALKIELYRQFVILVALSTIEIQAEKYFVKLQVTVGNPVVVFSVGSVVGQDSAKQDDTAKKATERKLKKELQGFEPFVGTWTIDAKWKSGGELWARNEYSIGMNGNFIEAKTHTKNEHGKECQRYFTIWRHNAEKKKVESYGFTFDGTVTIASCDMDTSDAQHPVIRSRWQMSDSKSHIKQEVRLIDAKSYSWKVWSSEDGDDWEQIMDGVWKKK